jgi:tetrahedral aminopeptidase
MNLNSLDFLKLLLSAPSPSGYEQPAQIVWREYTSQYSEKIDYDLHGNSIAIFNSTGSPKIMFAAHCDELGFIIKFIDEKGFIFFEPIGAHDLSIIAGRPVNIITANGQVTGITCKTTTSMLKKEDSKEVPEINNLWIDIGLSSREEAAKLVSIGDPIVYATEFNQINEKIVVSKGFDDKVGIFIISEVLRLLEDKKIAASVFGVSTVQEEIGLRGAQTSSFAIDPTIGIAIDVTSATDHPNGQVQKEGEIKIGAGPVILKGANANVHVVKLLIDTACEENIPYQIKASARATNTDANVMQLSRKGVATGLVSVPLRYIHTPTELISLEDVENTIKLLVGFTKRIFPEIDFRP